jgi:hypothetical protein
VNERCLEVVELLEPSEGAREHLLRCSECRELAREVEAVRREARALDPASWAGGPPVTVDVEAALSRLLAADAASARRPAHGARRSRVIPLAGALAAALLLFSLVAPFLLRLRIDTPPTARVPSAWLELERPSHAVFWTTPATGY